MSAINGVLMRQEFNDRLTNAHLTSCHSALLLNVILNVALNVALDLVLWESQVDSTMAWIKPTTGDRFSASKEVDSFFTVGLGIAKE